MTDSHAESPNLSDAKLLDRLCDEFEAAHGGEPRPRIEDYLTRSPARLRRHALRYLLSLDVELRRRNGETPKPSEYYARFPGEEADILAAWAAISKEAPEQAIPPDSDILATQLPQAANPTALPVQFGGYELLKEIGRGGMGVVFLAYQPSLKREVALKTILAGELAAPEEVQRFYSEARSAAQLDHQHIVPVYEVGEHQGQHFFTMAYVEGHSLAEQLQSGPLAPKEIARLLKTIAEAVQYAHEKGIVHRDLKPANILLDTEGRPRVTDFGLAKRLTESVGLTATGQLIGTLEYMPPEQALGQTKQLSPRADVYALGAILYRSLTGRPPFHAASFADTLQQVISHEPVAPRRLNPEIPLDLETICLACLEKNSARRYATARELADELGRYLRGEPIHRRRITRLERGARWCRRNPVIAGLLSVSALLLVALVAASLTGYLQTRNALKIAKENEGKAKISASKEKAAAKLAKQKQQEADVAAGKELKAREIAEKAADDAKKSATAAKVAADDAKKQKEAAERAQELERDQRRRAEDGAYANKISLAYQRWLSGDVRGAESLLGECPPEMRHWEWGYLKRLCHLDLLTIHGVNDGLNLDRQPDLAFTDDGKCVQVYGTEWDIQTDRPVQRISPPGPKFGANSAGGDAEDAPWRLLAKSVESSRRRPAAILLFSANRRWVMVAMPRPPAESLAPPGMESVEADSPGGPPPPTGLMGNLVTGNSIAAAPDSAPPASGMSPPPQVKADEPFLGIAVWEVATRIRKVHLKGTATSAAFSPDDRLFAWNNDRNTICVLDVESGAQQCTFPENAQSATCLAFSGDSALLAAGGSDQTVSIWDLSEKKRLRVLSDHRRVPHTLKFLPDAKTLVSLSATELRTWDATSGMLLRRIDAQNHIPTGLNGEELHGSETGNSSNSSREVRSVLALSPDGRRLATCDFRFIRIWDVSQGREMLTLSGHAYPIVAAAFDADASRIVSLDSEGTLKLWDAESPGEWFVRPALQGISDISRDGRVLVTGVGSQTNEHVTSADDATFVPGPAVDAVEVWQTLTGKRTARIPFPEQPEFCRQLTLSPSGRYLTIQSDRGARLFKCCDGQQVCHVPADGSERTFSNFVFSPDEQWLAVVNHNGSALWSLAQGRLVYCSGDWAVESFSPDSRRYAARNLSRVRAAAVEESVPTDDEMRGISKAPSMPTKEAPWIGVFDTATGKQTHGWVQRDARFSELGPEGLYFAPTGDKLVLWTGWGENRLWDIVTGKERTMHDFSGRDVSYGADGKEVAVGDLWETARVLDIQSGRCTHVVCSDSDIDMEQQILLDGSVGAISIDPAPCLKVGLTPDDRRLMTASTLGGSIRFWNTDDYHPIVNFEVFDSAAGRDPGNIRMSDNLLTVSVGSKDAIVLHAFPTRLAGAGIPAEALWRREVALSFLGRYAAGNGPLRTDTQFSPDGRWLAVPLNNSRFGGFAIHDTRDGRLVVQIPETGANAAFSPDGRYFAVMAPVGQIALWEIARGWTVEPHHRVAFDTKNADGPAGSWSASLAFSPDGRWLTLDAGSSLWECPELRPAVQAGLMGDACAFDDQGRIYAIRSGEKTVYGSKKPQDAVVLSRRTAAQIKSSPPKRGDGTPFAPVPDGRETPRSTDDQYQAMQRKWEELVKSGEDEWTIADDSLQILETASGKPIAFAMPGGNQLSVAPDGRWVAVASDEVNSSYYSSARDESVTGRAPLVAFDRETKTVHPLLTEKETAVVGLDSSADGRYLLAWTISGQSPVDANDPRRKEMLLGFSTARLFDMNEYKEVNFAEDASGATGFSHDGQRLAWVDIRNEVHVFDLGARANVAQLAGHSAHVNSLCFSADNRLIATASDDRTIRLWDLVEGKEAAVIPDHDGAVSWAEFNADGSRLASYALDGTLRIWDVKYLLAKPAAPQWLETPTFPNNHQIEQWLPNARKSERQNSSSGNVAPIPPPAKAKPQAPSPR